MYLKLKLDQSREIYELDKSLILTHKPIGLEFCSWDPQHMGAMNPSMREPLEDT